MSSLTRAIVHHTAGSEFNTTSYEASKAYVRGIQNLHMNNGWGDIGYHFLVDKFGNIFEGRHNSIPGLPRGAHDGTNTNSFGFNIMGFFHTPNNNVPTSAMMNSLYSVIAWRMPNGWSPYGSPGVYGPLGLNVGRLDSHRRVKSTACPGDLVHNPYIGNDVNSGVMRSEVNARINGFPTVFLRDWDLYQITNYNSGRCVDVPGFSTTAGVQLGQWSAAGNTAQTFQAIPVGSGWYKFKALCSGLVMDVNGGGGPAVIQWHDNGATAQHFMLQSVPGTSNVRILSRSSSKVVEVAGGSTGDGAKLQVLTWSGHPAQQWQFHHVPFRSGVYELQNVKSGKALDTPGFSPNAGVQMIQWDAAGNTAQRFDMQHTGFGWYEIRPLCSQMRLDIAGSGSACGTALQTWNDNNAAAQRFGFWDVGGGQWRIVNQVSVTQNKAVEVQFESTANGALVQLCDWKNITCQKWYIASSPFDEGDYEIVNAATGKALDVPFCPGSPGNQMHLWDRNGGACQSFHIKPHGLSWYSIKSNSSNLMLDVNGCSPANGTALIQWNDLGNNCQRFRFEMNDPAAGNWFIRSVSTGTCVDNTNGSSSNGNPITLWPLSRVYTQQQWQLVRK